MRGTEIVKEIRRDRREEWKRGKETTANRKRLSGSKEFDGRR